MRKEIKIGICAVIVLGAFWWGFSFLSGLDVLGRNNEYTIHYEDVNGLQGDAAVVINGVKVGQVANIALNKEKGGVDVTISISSEYDIPTDSRAVLFSAGLMGGKSIKIQLGEATEYVQNGEAIEAEVQSDMFDTLANEVGDIKERVVVLVDNVNQTVSGIDSLIDNNSPNVTLALANLNKVIEDLEKSKIIENIDGFCATLNKNGEKLDSIITDVGSVAHSISEQNLGEKLNAAIAQVSSVLNKINEGQGTIGNLVTDEKLYKELAQASQNLSLLLADIKENPKRYINVTVFGGKSSEEKKAEREAKKAEKAGQTK